MGYDINKIRQQVRKKVGKDQDPDEFKPPKADSEIAKKYRFFVLPPTSNMETFFVPHASHYIDNSKIGCPRIINDEKCPICQHGFDLMQDVTSKDERSKIARNLLSSAYYMVNIYFPPIDPNPEELRGKVFFYNASKTVMDLWTNCLNRDDAGDEQDPQAHGIFFDENDACLFQLAVKKAGFGNDYKESKFI